MPRRGRMRAGRGSRFPRKSNGTAPLTEARTGARKIFPVGRRRNPIPASATFSAILSGTLISNIGIRRRSTRFPRGKALSACTTCWETDGSGRRRVFAPFPGFEPFPFYRGYSANFFNGKHFVIKGGSPRTASVHAAAYVSQLVPGTLPIRHTRGFRCVSRGS